MSSSLQVGLRCARQCALRGAAAVDTAAAGSCCGGGFAPLANLHAGEESRRQHNLIIKNISNEENT